MNQNLLENRERLQRGFHYEIFIKRALKTHDMTARNGAEDYWFMNLIDAEKGIKHYKHPTYEKQFEKVLKFLDNAFTKFLKRRMTKEEKEKLSLLYYRFKEAKNTSDLSSILEEAVEVTVRFKEY